MKRTIVALGLSVWAVSARAAFEPLGYGAASKAMGGSVVSYVEDGSAAYWNPAGLSYVRDPHLTAGAENVYGLGLLRYDVVGYTHPGLGGGVLSAHLLRLHTMGEASFLKYAENTYLISYGRRLGWGVSGGVGFRYHEVVSSQKASGMGVDVGLTYAPFGGKFRLAGAIQDANEPRVRWATGAIDRIPSTKRAGLSFRVGPSIDVACQGTWREGEKAQVGAGASKLFLRRVALRGGIVRSPTQNAWNPAFGGGLKLGRVDVDYAWTRDDFLGDSQNLSLVIRFRS